MVVVPFEIRCAEAGFPNLQDNPGRLHDRCRWSVTPVADRCATDLPL